MKVVDPKKIFLLRKDKFKTQDVIASEMGMEHKTYAAKEKAGSFLPGELLKLAKFLKCSPEDFMSEAADNTDTAESFIISNQIRQEALLQTMLEFIAEVSAPQLKLPVTKVLSDLKKAVLNREEELRVSLKKGSS